MQIPTQTGMAELIYDLINRQFLCRKCLEPVTILFLYKKSACPLCHSPVAYTVYTNASET